MFSLGTNIQWWQLRYFIDAQDCNCLTKPNLGNSTAAVSAVSSSYTLCLLLPLSVCSQFRWCFGVQEIQWNVTDVKDEAERWIRSNSILKFLSYMWNVWTWAWGLFFHTNWGAGCHLHFHFSWTQKPHHSISFYFSSVHWSDIMICCLFGKPFTHPQHEKMGQFIIDKTAFFIPLRFQLKLICPI